jgi:hypothetical protein
VNQASSAKFGPRRNADPNGGWSYSAPGRKSLREDFGGAAHPVGCVNISWRPRRSKEPALESWFQRRRGDSSD